ncbi:3-oxoacyl-ACP reductase family protein [Vulgatibacter incomptus]|uniref:3-oxoacyl-[acyl-carrier protein] reductase n=1 Tax=Vulgatibacter incomptus TaxID=1391653 RepID=A0A0K1PEW1_9BACT|nr:3-oxoacyl-ACP reductase family protein [Vulgatibacter incomptus]AKU92055.1 3-oxoacyl-[acyl-carrier protein] reductase [Vulgatibacter incomptus]
MGKVALITGASGALGRAIAERLSAEGYDVALHYRAKEEEAKQLARELEAKGKGRAVPVQADIRRANEVDRMVQETEQALGPITLLVNNAGLVRDRSLHKLSDEDWDVVLDTNLRGAFRLCRAVSPGMRDRQQGCIVSISSIVGAMGNFGQANYAASKAGLIGLTKSLAKELARDRITVNAICPGFMDTPMVRAVPEAVQEKLVAQIPLGRFGEPSAVGEAVAYLAGPGGAWVTGQVLHVNGGMYM